MSRCYATCWTLPPLSGTKSTTSGSCGTERSKAPRCTQICDLLDNDEDGFEGDVWDADTGALEGKYKGVLGASTAQTVRRANTEAWRSFFENKKAYHDESNTSVTEHPEPPGFRGNENDGRVLKGVVRKDAYTVKWGDRSRLEMVVGKELRDRHNSPKSRLRLEIVGEPNWSDYEDQSRLELWYDETDSTFRASQPVTVSDDAQATPLASEQAVTRNRRFLVAHQT